MLISFSAAPVQHHGCKEWKVLTFLLDDVHVYNGGGTSLQLLILKRKVGLPCNPCVLFTQTQETKLLPSFFKLNNLTHIYPVGKRLNEIISLYEIRRKENMQKPHSSNDILC